MAVIDRNRIHEGMIVRNLDGDKVGRIIDCEDQDFVVEKEGTFSGGYVAGYDEVSAVLSDEVWLAPTEKAKRSGRGEETGGTEIRPLPGLWRAEDSPCYGDEGGGGF